MNTTIYGDDTLSKKIEHYNKLKESRNLMEKDRIIEINLEKIRKIYLESRNKTYYIDPMTGMVHFY